MSKLFAHVREAWRRHGPIGFLWLCLRNVAHYTRRLGRPAPPPRPLDAFDQQFGTDTSGVREIGSLNLSSENSRFGVRYQPSGAKAVRSAIAGLDIDPSRFSFVDFGSGKGRVLLIAAEYPFRSIVGIEFSQELHQVAIDNIDKLRGTLPAGDRIEARCGDAAEVDLPPNDLVCYFYNPFGLPVMQRVAERLKAHHRNGHAVWVIYVDPHHPEVFSEMFLKVSSAAGQHGETLTLRTPAPARTN